MYGAATFRMRAAVDLGALEWLPKFVLGVALLAWAVTFVGLCHHVAVNARPSSATQAAES
jgi:hypothetical protein